MDHQFTWTEQCKSCKGTGIYVGMAEENGAGIICSTCNGTGKCERTIDWDDFKELVPREDVKRVFRINPGIGIGENATIRLEDYGGMPYEDWLEGKPFPAKSEMRKYTCPAWYYQCADYNLQPKWSECIIIGSFSRCKCFENKEKCWEQWDKEFNKDNMG